ncbi:response regulator [Micromonospora echinofusca]|uniref:response regulator n=1 Tax=Micromonospora echinofusca TaxID=47858 RepID=UPI003F4DD0B1
MTTRILLADDHALVRRGVRLIVDSEPDLTVVAEAGDGAEAIALARSERPDLAILDIAMPRLTGLQAARELSRQQPGLRILILTMYDNEQYFFEALKVGANGYVLKSVADRDLVEACRAAVRDEPYRRTAPRQPVAEARPQGPAGADPLRHPGRAHRGVTGRRAGRLSCGRGHRFSTVDGWALSSRGTGRPGGVARCVPGWCSRA